MPRARLVFDGDWVYTEKEARIHKLTQETETKIDNIPGVVDDVNSTSTTDALSANMGKRLQDQINQLTWLNKFLSTWDCTTGLPVTDPSATPFTYTSGNYYLVATVAWEWGTNYKPHWNTFTPWVASTAVETNEVNVNDMYIFDWTQWILQVNKVKEIIVDDGLSPDSTNAVENRAIYNALTTKQNKILDLADIRAGAALGMTSIQPWDNITELTNNVGYQTAGDVAAAIEALAPHWVWEWVLTLQKNSTTLDTFSANATQNKTINITVPTTVAELSDASDYVTDTELSTTLEDYATKDYVDWNVIHSWPTAPSPAEEWMLWYDTTNDVLKVYDWTQWNLTWKVYSSWTGINVDNTNDTISNTWVLSVNGSTWAITWIATEQYVDNAIDEAIEDSKYVWPTAPSNPTEGMLWYDTTNDVLKVYDWTNWVEVWVGDWDMKYEDFYFEDKTWATITLWLSTVIAPTSNFTVNAPATIENWQTYILRINSDSIAYTMTLWTNVTNPYEEDLSLTPYGIDQFTFLAIGWKLELQPSLNKYDAGDGIEINNNEISVDRQVISSISVSGASMWAFANACKANWTLHTTNFSWPITYTFKWLWFVKVWMMHWYALSLNDIEMFNYYFTSWTYTDIYYLWPYTASVWDVLKVWIPWSQWTIWGTIYDYYNE